MTELTEKFRQLYEKYENADEDSRKRSFGDLFRGWFSGKGKQSLPVDSDFMADVERLTESIKDEGDGDDALFAILLILSRPRGGKFSEQDIIYTAMYKHAIKLVPMIPDDGVEKAYEALNAVPKQYRFPVYTELKQSLDARSKQ